MIETIAANPDKERRVEYVIALLVVFFFGAMTWQFLADESSPLSLLGEKGALFTSPSRSDDSGMVQAEVRLSDEKTAAQLSEQLDNRATQILQQDVSPGASLVASSARPDVLLGSDTAPARSRVSPTTVIEQPTLKPDARVPAELPIDVPVDVPVDVRDDAVGIDDNAESIEASPRAAVATVDEPASTENVGESERVAAIEETVPGASNGLDQSQELISPAETALPSQPTSLSEGGSPPERVSPVRSLADAEVLFAEASSELSQDALSVLEQFAAVLERYPELNLRISGYADPIGNEELNRQLSEQRALACRDFLSVRGIDGSRLIVESYGEVNASEDVMNEAFLQNSRRVELRLEM